MLVAAAVAAWGVGRWRWRARLLDLHGALATSRLDRTPAVYSDADLALVPPTVARFFAAVLRPGQRLVAAARLRHRGTMDLGPDTPAWVPFTSTQQVVTRRPAFVWDATVTVGGLVPVRVVDAYVGGEGVTVAALGGLVPVAEQRGRGAAATAQLLRFLAEAAWYPTALLPSQGVRWREVDGGAEATLQDGEASAVLAVAFDDEGRIARVRAAARGRRVAGELVPTPWVGRFGDYAEQDGMQVPRQGEVAWELPDGERPYWRGRLESVEYEWAP
ncbi:MAG: hypothetical protein KF830_17210 [Planctomycetes bacterium]|nr:hypothetical protein [Planctomycetota bacterium]